MYKLVRSSAGTVARYVRKELRRARRRGAGSDGALEIAFVILPSDEIHNRMRRLQLDLMDRYGVSSGLRASPHISLKQGFRAPRVDPFERYFDELVTQIEPFDVRMSGVAAFDEDILFVDVEPEPRLEALRRRILRDLATLDVEPGAYEGDQFHFHATLAYGLPKDVLASAREALSDARVDRSFTLDTLALLLQVGDGWTTYKRARLSTLPPEPSGASRGSA